MWEVYVCSEILRKPTCVKNEQQNPQVHSFTGTKDWQLLPTINLEYHIYYDVCKGESVHVIIVATPEHKAPLGYRITSFKIITLKPLATRWEGGMALLLLERISNSCRHSLAASSRGCE